MVAFIFLTFLSVGYNDQNSKMNSFCRKSIIALIVVLCMGRPLHAQTIKLEKYGNTYKTSCKVNGLKLNMFLDTGADVVTISALEALFMFKNGYLSEDDIVGSREYQTANGDISEGTEIILRRIEIGGKVLTNVKATIVHSLEAPLLMGQSALSKLGKITIDYKLNTLTINSGAKGSNKVIEEEKEEKAEDSQEPVIAHKVAEKKPPVAQKDMVFVAGGSFQMGNDFGKDDEKPVHTIAVGSFYMSKYEVTVGDYRKFVKATGYRTKAEVENWVTAWDGTKWSERHNVWWEHDAAGNKRSPEQENEPVLYLTWGDASKYCEWMTSVTGKLYRLPTEAEWEYAAKGGKLHHSNVYSGNNDISKAGWYMENGNTRTHPVGKKAPNELGIYDMTGNVIEFTSDWYNDKYYSVSPDHDPHGPDQGKAKVARGGGWHNKAPDCRNTDRHYDELWSRCNYNGFRVVMNE